ncbi:ORF061 [Saltwater crocodilepox virus]|nr:Apc11-like protein [Saltwater crocodilepox virus]QGT46500.1 ORF061 [Saltwater crocodilepox virus]QGT46716.1 ORF061 [Saltwater crocodilepox virus]QGT46933.1 ORF061 [Saltwater crocodilepox virus]QGT47362.1 ORF061 [Saltwater crocodilepox virus]
MSIRVRRWVPVCAFSYDARDDACLFCLRKIDQSCLKDDCLRGERPCGLVACGNSHCFHYHCAGSFDACVLCGDRLQVLP